MKHLLAITIGPVQGFIAAARRTRDLWAGSLLLSEISKAVARTVHQAQRGALIFPSPGEPDADLAPYRPEQEQARMFTVANVILAEVDAAAVGGVVARAQAAADDTWRAAAERGRSAVADAVESARFEQQLRGVIEFRWASAELPEGAYGRVRREVMRALAARKACRDFEPWKGYAKLPKSSLDGLRETIWIEDRLKSLAGWKKAQLRLNDGEQLDAVGLAKRLGMGARQFPSVARIAAEPWIDVLEKRGLLPRLVEACEPLRGDTLVTYSTGRFPQFRRFAFDGTAVYLSRLREIEPSSEDSEHIKNVVEANVAVLGQTVQELSRVCGPPSPYLAVLAADGDRMGEQISKIESVEEHRRFSRALAGFATAAERVVREHGGALVFAGGDDVLAFVPAHRAIECAAALRAEFLQALRTFPGPTLSVGIAYGHFLEDLEDLVKRAKDAEHEAKQPDRNGLAVRYSPRNQEGRLFRCRWESKPEELLTRMIGWHRQSLIPDQAAYQLTGLARHYSKWAKGEPVTAAMQADAQRLLSRKARKTAPAVLAELRESVKANVKEPADLQRLADQLVVTRKLAPIGVSR